MFATIHTINMSEVINTNNELESEKLLIEAARPGDEEAIAELLRITWQATYPNAEAGITEEDIRLRTEGENGERIPKKIERWRKNIEITDGSKAVYVARLNDIIVGVTAPNNIDGRRRLGALYVLPDLQGKGVGGKLIRKALDWHGDKDDIYLNVASYNKNAIDFYKRFGFEETDTIVVDKGDVYGETQIPEIEMVLKAKD